MVFTNGCFDILHEGHVSYLFKARTKGDALIVAINSDASVKKLKGMSRPINKLKSRMNVIAGLECVDYVTWFGEQTPVRILKKLRPKVLVKASDYKKSQVAGVAEVQSWGGKFCRIPVVKGRSTTRILAKVQKKQF